MEFLIYLLIFLSVTLFVYFLYDILFLKKVIIKQRLDVVMELSNDADHQDELKQPFLQRVIKPGYQKILKTIGNATPKSIKEKYEALIVTTGINNVTVNNIVMIQLMLGIIFAGCLYSVYKFTLQPIDYRRVVSCGIGGTVLPILYLYQKAQKRKTIVRRALPDLLDLLYVSVEAGLGFDAALKKSAEKMKGPLSFEIMKSLNEITKGRDREEALRGLVYRTGVEDVGSFITSVIQTEKLGSNIANMLRIQSNTMRQKRRQRAEQSAAKLPVKMLFPMIFLIMPAMFVVILGPAIINIIETLSSLN